MEQTIIECTFDPNTSELKDVFANKHARAIWSLYRRSHIISADGLKVLNEWCKNLLEDDWFDYNEAKSFLTNLIFDLGEAEHSSFRQDSKFIDEVIPYLLDQKEVILTVKKQNREMVG